MKNKSNLLLLLLLPLLTSCPPSYGGPLFEIQEFADSNVVEFYLPDGLDLTAPFGLYEKLSMNSSLDEERKYMFLATNDEEDGSEKWECIYDITESNTQCYWIGARLGHDVIYNKKAKLHLRSKFFDSKSGTVRILLTRIKEYSAEKETYTTNELSYESDRINLFYSIDEDSNVSVTASRYYLPKASSSEQYSSEEQTIPVESSEESLSSSLT